MLFYAASTNVNLAIGLTFLAKNNADRKGIFRIS